MSIAVQQKLNTGFIERPLSWFKKAATRAASKITGYWYSFSSEGNACNVGYSTLCEKLGTSRATVSRTVRAERKRGNFNVVRNGGKNTAYTYVYERSKEFRVRTELYFYTDFFRIDDTVRTLTDAEVDVLSLIYTWTRYEKTKQYVGNYGDIARQLGLDYFTVRRVVKSLFSAKLINRPIKGSNDHDKSVYKANMSRLRKHEKQNKKAESKKMAEKVRIDTMRAEQLEKEKIERIVERNKEKLEAHPRFREIDPKLRRLEIDIAKAEVYAPLTAQPLYARREELLKVRAEIMHELGLEDWRLDSKKYKEHMRNVGAKLDKGGGGT